MAASVVPHSNVSDAFVAETLACKNAIQVAKDMRFLNVIIERDSLTVVKKLKTTHDSSIIAPIIVDINDLAKSFNSISFCFVHKGQIRGVVSTLLSGSDDYVWCFEPLAGNLFLHLVAKALMILNRRRLTKNPNNNGSSSGERVRPSATPFADRFIYLKSKSQARDNSWRIADTKA
ncbi:hypothetical protein V6N12_051532 [Hibiscus sabdariffa]|uniref:RNase H type-1 domain-containing protein n=1 Tax=Hibiscus sabdariffa TaxID=183260 RepID=A0ABR2GFN2_9ROSI